LAARCLLADGRRCFVKAVSPDQNPDTPNLYRQEAKVVQAMPAGLPVPHLIEVIDDGEWVVLVFEEIEGRPPPLPWSLADLRAVFVALDELAELAAPSLMRSLPSLAERLGASLSGYRRLAGGDPAVERIDAWSRRHLQRLAELEAGWPEVTVGDTLLHTDLRADNLLVRSDGGVVLVDWPHACVGAAWVDKAAMLPSVGLDGGPTPAEVEIAIRPFASVEDEALDRFVVAMAGYFAFHGTQPDPPGLPTLRAFQRAQGQVARCWAARRLKLG
jgi:Ser/Thr protein kinase RdoA (MazF antagonist)